MGHPLSFEFARRLSEVAPGGPKAGLDRVFFTNSGSEAVDTALKIAVAYQRAIGQGTRYRLIGREYGYHGVGFGGISVGGLVNNRRSFPLLPGTDYLRHTRNLPRNAFSRRQPAHGAELADDLEAIVALHGAETIAAIIVEPVAGSAGVLPPPVDYLERLRAICDRHGIVLIFDEVITGFGRMGTPFATDYFGVRPDIVTTAKGLTNGVLPMGAVFSSRSIHDAVMQAPDGQIEFFHGYTYSGLPAACAAGLATLDIYESEALLNRGADMEDVWIESVQSLRGLPHVIDIRAIGFMAGIELEPRPGAPGVRAYEIFVDCFERGLLVRATGDTLALSPPLIAQPDQFAVIVDMLSDALRRAA
jgi:beta-alanine--pyruvate transaminase